MWVSITAMQWSDSKYLRASKAYTKFVVCFASFVDALFYGLIVPVLPFALSDRIHVPEDQVQQWNSMLLGTFSLAIAVTSVPVGWIGDHAPSRKLPFVGGSVVLTGSTLVFMYTHSLLLLGIARALQGVSASVAATVGGAILLDKCGEKEIGEASGWRFTALILGFSLGPIVGGMLYDYGGYYAVFAPALCFVLLEIILRASLIEGREHYPEGSAESPLLQDANCGSKFYSTSNDSSDAIACDTDVEGLTTQQPEAIQPSDDDAPKGWPLWILATYPRFVVIALANGVVNSLSGAVESVLPLYGHDVFGMSPKAAGLAFLPFCIPVMFSPLAGTYVDRVGARWPGSIAFASGGVAFTLMALVRNDSGFDLALLLVGLLMFGVIFTFAAVSASSEVAASITELEAAHPGAFGEKGAFSTALGVTNTTVACGIMAGTLYGGFLREGLGWPAMNGFMALLCLATALAICVVTGRPVKRNGSVPSRSTRE
ncbi:MAG: hypothetical protein M1831_006703 [Alyxoria varia]|nr:MAG: hypothetical protein M1831_006703 [Alyxoria varia]